MRAAAWILGTFALLGGAACTAILGLEERTLVAASDGEAGPADAGVADTGPSPCFVGAGHAFCEDFDDLNGSFDAAIALWQRWGYLQGTVGDSPFTGSVMTIETDPALHTPPHDLRVDVTLPTALGTGLGLGMLLHQSVTMDPSVIGLEVRMLLRMDRYEPSAEAGTLLDSGERLIGGTIALANPDTNNGVAIVWTSTAADLGFATGLTTVSSRFAQGSTFWPFGPVLRQWLPLRIVVAPTNHPSLANLECKSGLALYQADGGIVVADGGVDASDHVPYGVGVFFPPAGKGLCERLGADLDSPVWTRQAVLMLGVVANGAGAMSASFDDVVVDFLR